MTTPRVTELPLRLAPVERDPFADALPGSGATLQRRAALVREVMRTRAEQTRPRGPARRSGR